MESFQIGLNPDPVIYRKVSKKSDIQAVLDEWVPSDSMELFLYSDKPAKELFKKLKKLFRIINAAGGLVINTRKQLLFIRRLGLWDLPKGKAEKDEHIRDTAIREVTEETGLKPLRILFSLDSTYHVYYTSKSRILKKTYWYLMMYEGSAEPVPQIEESITDVRWFDLEESAILARQTYPSLREILVKAITFFKG
ncbi:MAG: NUDIX domain-containing protein [Bacteroidota bacterium]